MPNAPIIEIPANYFPAEVLGGKEEIPDDFTFYLPNFFSAGAPRDMVFSSLARQGKVKADALPFAYAGKLTIKIGDYKATGRGLACLSYNSQFWSFSFRKETGDDGALTEGEFQAGNAPEKGYKPKERKSGQEFLNSLEELRDSLYEKIFDGNIMYYKVVIDNEQYFLSNIISLILIIYV